MMGGLTAHKMAVVKITILGNWLFSAPPGGIGPKNLQKRQFSKKKIYERVEEGITVHLSHLRARWVILLARGLENAENEENPPSWVKFSPRKMWLKNA